MEIVIIVQSLGTYQNVLRVVTPSDPLNPQITVNELIEHYAPVCIACSVWPIRTLAQVKRVD